MGRAGIAHTKGFETCVSRLLQDDCTTPRTASPTPRALKPAYLFRFSPVVLLAARGIAHTKGFETRTRPSTPSTVGRAARAQATPNWCRSHGRRVTARRCSRTTRRATAIRPTCSARRTIPRRKTPAPARVPPPRLDTNPFNHTNWQRGSKFHDLARRSTGCRWPWPTSAWKRQMMRDTGFTCPRPGSISLPTACRPVLNKSSGSTCTPGWKRKCCVARRRR